MLARLKDCGEAIIADARGPMRDFNTRREVSSFQTYVTNNELRINNQHRRDLVERFTIVAGDH